MTVSRPFPTPAHTRPSPLPSEGITLHAIGDVHLRADFRALQPWRGDTMIRDTARTGLSPVAAIQLGDNVDNDPAGSIAAFQHLMDRLGTPWHAVMGNHDINNDVQTPAQWAARLGYPGQNYTVDLPGLRLVMFSPSQEWVDYNNVTADNLTWLDQAIGGTTDPVFVCCHFPIWDTVPGSTTAMFFVRTTNVPDSSDEVLDVLAAHDNLKAWISGHTHSPVTDPGLVMPVEHAGHRLAAINTSCIWYSSGGPGAANNQISTLYITWLGDRIEVRPRNHGGGAWQSPNGNPVLTVTGLG